jgi:hypothetical protein
MATIRARRQSDGTTRYTAIVRIRKGKTVVHQECKTFPIGRPPQAGPNTARSSSRILQAVSQKPQGTVTLSELIRWYIETFETISNWQRSKQSHLHFLARHAIGAVDVFELTPATLIKHVRTRRADGAGPATAILFGSVWSCARRKQSKTFQ